MKGVVHEFGKAFTFRLYIDLSGNYKVSRKRPFLGWHLALALRVRFWLILLINMYLAMSAPSAGIT